MLRHTLPQGTYDDATLCAMAYDTAALKLYGDAADTNFPRSVYAARLAQLAGLSAAQAIRVLRCNASGPGGSGRGLKRKQ